MTSALPAHVREFTTDRVRDRPDDPDKAANDDKRPEVGPVAPPDWIREEVKPYFKHFAELLHGMRVPCESYIDALGMLASVSEEYVRAEHAAAEVPPDSPNNVRWTAISHLRSCERQRGAMLKEFGLTPAAAVKVRAG